MSRIVDKNQLQSYFPQATHIFRTSGTREGTIIKFNTFYLKIYDDDKEDTYIVEIYRYGCNDPVMIDSVPLKNMREYAAALCG